LKSLVIYGVQLVQRAMFDWYLEKTVRGTLKPDRTESVLRGRKTSTVYW
jgi:hypothetical protein